MIRLHTVSAGRTHRMNYSVLDIAISSLSSYDSSLHYSSYLWDLSFSIRTYSAQFVDKRQGFRISIYDQKIKSKKWVQYSVQFINLDCKETFPIAVKTPFQALRIIRVGHAK